MTQPALPRDAYDLEPGAFARRQVWARSRGCEGWLWPDIAIEEWRAARETVTAVLAEALRHGQAGTALAGDPDTLSLAAFTAGLGPLLGWWIAEDRVTASEEVAAVMDLHLRHNRLRMERMQQRALDVVRALADRSIPVTVLKGMHTAFAYFPDPATRPLSDIDLAVEAADADRANAYFRDAGYQLKYQSPREHSWGAAGLSIEPRSLMLTHADDPWTVDLHNALDYTPSPRSRPTDFGPLAYKQAGPGWPCGGGARVLPQPLLLLHLAAHAASPFSSLTPLRMAEAVMVIRRDADSENLRWPEFIDTGRAAKALGLAYPLLRSAESLVPGTVPADVLEASGALVPRAVRETLRRLPLAHVQAIARQSLTEHLMWCADWRDMARSLVRDLIPTPCPEGLGPYYRRRAVQLFRGRIRYGLG